MSIQLLELANECDQVTVNRGGVLGRQFAELCSKLLYNGLHQDRVEPDVRIDLSVIVVVAVMVVVTVIMVGAVAGVTFKAERIACLEDGQVPTPRRPGRIGDPAIEAEPDANDQPGLAEPAHLSCRRFEVVRAVAGAEHGGDTRRVTHELPRQVRQRMDRRHEDLRIRPGFRRIAVVD